MLDVLFVMILMGLVGMRRESFVVSGQDENKSVGHEKPKHIVVEETSEIIRRVVQKIKYGGTDEEGEDRSVA